MNSDLVKDIKVFYKTIGFLDEASERQIESLDDLNNKDHKKYLDKLLKKYNIEYENNNDYGMYEEILEIEGLIDEKFTKIMESGINEQ